MNAPFINQIISKLFVVIAILLLAYELYYNRTNISITQLIIIILLLAVVYGIHGILLFEEMYHYNYNPLHGPWLMEEKPVR